MSHLEETLERDAKRIRRKMQEMAGLCGMALEGCLKALADRNRQLAYSVIMRDQRIDELEKEVDRLCLEFILRQQPVASMLRFIYSAIKVNSELERVGDYAESMARQILTLADLDVVVPIDRFREIAGLAVPMFHSAVEAYLSQNVELARKTIESEDAVDRLRHELNRVLLAEHQERKVPVEALSPLMAIVNRFERVADQAKAICEEAIYVATGEYLKHPGSEVFRVLFVDEHNSCRSQIAEAIGTSLGQPKFVFTSAGLDRQPIDPETLRLLKERGLDTAPLTSKTVEQVPHLDRYQIVVALAKEAKRVFPPPPNKAVLLDWSLPDPSKRQGTPEDVRSMYERTYTTLEGHVRDLVEAVLGDG